ncbi:hypothetical protein J3Q64DRAFT_1769939 [Phycomyces blakesleeanus]|uniref:PH domain-containing protein n=2 Tax=Phycomyces blakesleeanus TaxID=4837 RepID=A0A162NB31_PHYB8|nr:hypothetical protein PHYBLDRAFT_174198 [Phycomyces blakesleeanus NRRL 1555(-)]OAD67504.1 hypothetical protein PHYBLDRAFT_174198 [Phycomyces blakesleeanus NRRL 1555(-)]|eukprot:XP_018285544.1 hypothetical protein PHYBLDRAFT_174198 [Phycomyces blakesleeanus NRRL 1555(-)]
MLHCLSLKTKDTIPMKAFESLNDHTLHKRSSHISFSLSFPLKPYEQSLNHERIEKEGRLICTKSQNIYRRHSHEKRLNHTSERQERLHWREFYVELTKKKIVLFSIKQYPGDSCRIAHEITFEQPGLRLTPLSPLDGSFCLRIDNRTQDSAFLFEAPSRNEAFEWFIEIYHKIKIKSPIPSFIDVNIPLLGLDIRAPLPSASTDSMQLQNIRTCVLTLLKAQNIPLPAEEDKMRLCWEYSCARRELIKHGRDNPGDPVLSFQLISQIPRLVLCTPVCPLLSAPAAHEGHLTNKYDNRKVYYILDHGLLFMIKNPKDEFLLHPAKQSFASALFRTTQTFLLKQIPAFNLGSQYQTNPNTPANQRMRRASHLLHADSVIDLRQIIKVEHSNERADNLDFRLISSEGVIIEYTAESRPSADKWIRCIKLWLDYMSIQPCQPLKADKSSNVMYSGPLFFKHKYNAPYKDTFCVYVKQVGLLVFRRWQKERSKSLWSPVYKKMFHLPLKDTYLLASKEAIRPITRDKEIPSRWIDGPVEASMESSGTFVVWKPKDTCGFKWGHRLGRRGKQWIFLANGESEKDGWLWALQALSFE